ncbi:internal scaffolding protein [Microviridae sp.]|nr:internal scaffolding protein [Microviridae sp.]
MKFRSGYSKAVRVPFSTHGPSMARQEFKAECDVNNIMKKFERTGAREHLEVFEGRYGDFLDAPEYQDAMNQILLAQDMFESVPAKIRKDFDNDPSKFLAFAQDPDNIGALRDYGLASPLIVPEPDVSIPQGTPVEASADNMEPQEG